MKDLQQCHACGGMFPDGAMADWTICFGCKKCLMEEARGKPVFMDCLGIAWTQSEIEEAGGLHEVERMVTEADVRRGGL